MAIHPTQKRGLIFILCASLFICSQFYRVSNAIMAPLLQADLDISSESLGILSAAYFYAFALAQIPLGISLDRVGARLTMTLLTIIGSIGSLIFGLSHGIAVAILGRALIGLGMAGNMMGSMKLFTRWFSPREFATLSGLIIALGTFGNMLAATPLALLIEGLGWRLSFVMIGLVTAFLAIIFFTFVEDAPRNAYRSGPEVSVTSSAIGNIKLLLKSRGYWIISIGSFLRYGIFVAIQGLWAGPYLIKALGFSTIRAGNLLLLLNIGYLLGAPFSGWLSDRIIGSPKRVVLIGLASMALLIFLLSSGCGADSYWGLGGILLAFGVFTSFGFIMYAHIKELMPSDMSGMALTSINLFTMLGGAVFMQTMGLLLDHMSPFGDASPKDYQAVFFLGFLGIILAFFLYFFTKETGSGPFNSVEDRS